MSLTYSFGTLSAAIQAWTDINSIDVVNNMADVIQKGELRLYHLLDLDNLDPTISGILLTGNSISKPSNLIRERMVALVLASSGVQSGILRKVSNEFIFQYLQDAQGNTGPPKYYAENDQNTWIVAPQPVSPYHATVRGIFRPVLLGDNGAMTNLAGIAASQHTTAATPLTLTSSPFIFSAQTPPLPSSQVFLFSSGNMSANVFTVVGLDDDGNALSEQVAGPNAGTTQTVGVYSQVTSITPSTTDGVNNVTAGWSQDNSTWLSTRFPELLFWCCVQYACQFNKRWTAADKAEAEIQKLVTVAQNLTRNLKRTDFDDLYVGRQNLGAPGAIPLPVPPQSGTPAPGGGR